MKRNLVLVVSVTGALVWVETISLIHESANKCPAPSCYEVSAVALPEIPEHPVEGNSSDSADYGSERAFTLTGNNNDTTSMSMILSGNLNRARLRELETFKL